MLIGEVQKVATNSFNRNIVECKLRSGRRIWQQGASFNRNIVECKLINASKVKKAELGFNRNIVECKFAILERQRSACFKF